MRYQRPLRRNLIKPQSLHANARALRRWQKSQTAAHARKQTHTHKRPNRSGQHRHVHAPFAVSLREVSPQLRCKCINSPNTV
jgi:hypothetical protein